MRPMYPPREAEPESVRVARDQAENRWIAGIFLAVLTAVVLAALPRWKRGIIWLPVVVINVIRLILEARNASAKTMRWLRIAGSALFAVAATLYFRTA